MRSKGGAVPTDRPCSNSISGPDTNRYLAGQQLVTVSSNLLHVLERLVGWEAAINDCLSLSQDGRTREASQLQYLELNCV